MTQPTRFSTSTTSIAPTVVSTATRRVRFKIDDNDQNQNNNRHTRSSDDVRLPGKNVIHRVEFEIPIYKGIKSIKYQLYHILLFFFFFSLFLLSKRLIHG
jgi:hypothetical protein